MAMTDLVASTETHLTVRVKVLKEMRAVVGSQTLEAPNSEEVFGHTNILRTTIEVLEAKLRPNLGAQKLLLNCLHVSPKMSQFVELVFALHVFRTSQWDAAANFGCWILRVFARPGLALVRLRDVLLFPCRVLRR